MLTAASTATASATAAAANGAMDHALNADVATWDTDVLNGDDDDDDDAPPSPLLSGSRSPPPRVPCTTPGAVLDVATLSERADDDEDPRPLPLPLPLPPMGTFKPKFTRNGPRPRHYSAPYPVRGTFLPVATGQATMPVAASKVAHVSKRADANLVGHVEQAVHESSVSEPLTDHPSPALLCERKSDVLLSAEDIHAARVLAGIHSTSNSHTNPPAASTLPSGATRRASLHVPPTASATYSYAALAAAMSMYAAGSPSMFHPGGYPISPTYMYSPWSYLPSYHPHQPAPAPVTAPPSPPPSSTSGSPPPAPPTFTSMLDEVVHLAQTVGGAADAASDDMVTRTLDRMRRQVDAGIGHSRKQFDADYAWLKKYLAIRLFTGGSSGDGGQGVPSRAAGGMVAAAGAEEVSVAAVQEAVKLARGGMHGGLVMGTFDVGGGWSAVQRS